MSVVFHYEVRDGWLRCGLAVKGVTVSHSVGGWHDGLQELLRAACEMLGRASEANAVFQEEPGEFRWRITRLSANRLRVRVLEFDDWGSGLPDAAGAVLFDQPCGAASFGRAIYNGTREEQDGSERLRLGNILRQFEYH